MTLYLADNQITAIPDGLCRQSGWMQETVSTFQCNAILCPPNTFSEYGRAADSASQCADCPSGSSSPFYGSFSCLTSAEQDILDERAILQELYRSTNGDFWEFKENWMDPDVSMCEWRGVICTGDSTSVESIYLMNNGLHGVIPSSIFSLPNLRELNFAGNKNLEVNFSGIGTASMLEYINLDSTDLGSLSGIQNAPNLKLIHAEDNSFTAFPSEVFSIGSLESLSLSGNSFGGSVSSSISNLASLVSFSCSGCGFSGPLPTHVGSLVGLEYLHLDHNYFYGAIPTEVQSLTNLKTLDLSSQLPVSSVASELSSTSQIGFGGPLPSFANFTQLSILNLQYNSFTGSIPATFLQGVGNSGLSTVDLRGNQLTGALPSQLSRFPSLNFYAADNMIR